MSIYFSFYQYFKNKYSQSGLPEAEQRRLRLTHFLNYSGIFSHFLYCAFYLLIDAQHLYMYSVILVIFTIPYFLSLRFLSKGKYAIAKFFLTYFIPVSCIIGSVFFLGRESNFHFYLLLFIILPFMVWAPGQRWKIVPAFFFNVVFFCLIQYGDLNRLSITRLPSEFEMLHTTVTIMGSFLILLSVVLWYMYVSESYENRLHEWSETLAKTNTELNDQKNIITEANNLLIEKQEEIEMQAESLIKVNRELRESVATKDKFFSIISHDLRNPMGTLHELSNVLYKEHDRFDQEQKEEIIKAISESSRSAYNLLENLLTWSRLQTGRMQVRPEKINLFNIINETLGLLENMRSKKDIVVFLPEGKSQEVYADRAMISSLLNNLLSNAMKFTPEGGKIRISYKQESEFTEVCICDSGLGISPENIPKLFRIDQSYSTRGTNREKGTGLGLLLCKEFVEQNGGRIWAESKVGKGSRFFFTLPSGS